MPLSTIVFFTSSISFLIGLIKKCLAIITNNSLIYAKKIVQMKILHVLTSMDPKQGGVCQVLRNLNPYLIEKGINVEIVCLDNENEDFSIHDDFTVHKIGNGKTSYQYQPELIKWLNINVIRFDFVIVHGLWQYHNLAVYKSIKFLKKQNKKTPRVVIMPHGMLDPYFQRAPERKWKAVRNEIVWSLIEKKCINYADMIFYTCDEEMRLAPTTFKGYKPLNVANVGLGIQPPPTYISDFKEAFYNTCIGVKNKKYWLFISRIHPKKGVDLLIEAYTKLVAENHSLPELVIAGPTDSAYAQEMIKKAKAFSSIHFPGMLTGYSKWGAFYGCEAYLLPSHQENFGIAIVEAMACKKPVLITKNINIWREIEAGKGGWVLDELTVESIKNQLLTISLLDEPTLQAKGQAAFETYENKFDVEDCTKVFIDTLKNL